MRKKEILIGLVLMFTLLSSFLVVAQDVCCEKTIDLSDDDDSTLLIFDCLNAPIEQCDTTNSLRTAPTSCDQTDYCKLETCVNTNTGTCMPRTPYQVCINEGGSSIPEDREDIPACQEGCCGNGIAFVSSTECEQLATDYGIDTNFRADIRDAETCFALASTEALGACVIEAEFTEDCTIETRNNCPADATFHEGSLCSASGVSDCAKSRNTRCENSQVYFLDSCDNLANVYDEDMFTTGTWTQEMEHYWTYIQEPSCEITGADDTCGNCNYVGGTMCKDEREVSGLDAKYGNYVCGDLSCSYDTDGDGTKETYAHGESWCAESEGTYWHIPVDMTELDTLREDTDLLPGLENVEAYNLPGSRYYQLQCWDGEVISYPCRDHRNEICKEVDLGTDSRFLYARCWINDWRSCPGITNAIDCEDPLRDCKWMEGYRFNRTIVENIEEQGSCVPLYAPGFDFWEPEDSGHAICALGGIEERVFYETPWYTRRDKFADKSTTEAAHNCLENCYAIPDYGTSGGLTPALVSGLYSGASLTNNIRTYNLSTRRGHYCSLRISEGMAIGSVTGDSISCTSDEDRRPSVLFYTHQQWLDFIRTRARSLGDCGFKDNFLGVSGEPGAELITVMFEKLTQDGNALTNETTTETIYIGNERIFDEYRLDE